jgi:hypothetical protein
MYFWAFMVALLVFSLGGGISIYHGIISLKHPPGLGDPTWNYIVLAVAALGEGLSWRVSNRKLARRKRSGENLWQTVQRSPDATVFTVFVEDSAALTPCHHSLRTQTSSSHASRIRRHPS